MKEENEFDLLLDEEDRPILVEEECKNVKPIIEEFVRSYAENQGKTVEYWLVPKMQEQLPEKSREEIETMVEDIVTAIKVSEEKKDSLNKAITNGRSKESWFASEVKNATSAMSTQEAAKYLASLDKAVNQANQALHKTITTQAGNVSQNPSLDGFIAEQYHAQTFNMNAEASGSQYRAKVLEPDGNGYAKNSVDIVIVDGEGKVVRRYQSKYCKDAKATEKAFEHGDYRGQQKLIPKDQENGISKKSTSVLEAPDGTTSNPLTKSDAEKMRDEAQSGNWNDLNWNEYTTKDLAIGIGKQTGYAALQGAAIGVGFDVAQKVWNGEEIEADEVVETALTSGADAGVKAATAGALKVGAEKGIIKVIPKGTPASTIANIACVAVENVKVLGKVATGELTVREGVEKMAETTVSTTAGLIGAKIGTSIGTVLGPVGNAVGGFIGGTVGYMAGSKVGQTIVKGAKKGRDVAVETVKTVASGIKEAASTVVDGVKSGVSWLAGLFGF